MSTITVQELAISPIKSGALVRPDQVCIQHPGIAEDRRFFVINEEGRLLTQRQVGALALLRAAYTLRPERLSIAFPDGSTLEEDIIPGEAVTVSIFRNEARGRVLAGDWNNVLSLYCRQPVRLVRADEPGQAVDLHPVSILSAASVAELNRRAPDFGPFTTARFRPNLLLAGAEPHQEDTWLGKRIKVGDSLVLRIVMQDPRCAQTTINPQTGQRDVDTLRAISSYRPSPDRRIYFGVYATVEQPGIVRLGDRVVVG